LWTKVLCVLLWATPALAGSLNPCTATGEPALAGAGLVQAATTALTQPGSADVEHLVAVDATGAIVYLGDDSRASVDRALVASAALLHNHPRDLPLSAADLSLLVRPLLLSITAAGPRGSAFRMTRGPAFDEGALIERLRAAEMMAERAIPKTLSEWTNEPRMPLRERLFLVQHAMALALAAHGDVRYAFTLTPEDAALLRTRCRDLSDAFTAARHVMGDRPSTR
jgi:hypothetical protein